MISLEETLKPYLEKLLQVTEAGVELAAQEIPLIIQEWLMYNGVTSSIWVVLSICVLILAWRSAKPLFDLENRKYYDSDKDLTENAMVQILLVVFLSLIGGVVFFMNIFEVIQIFFFPRVYLLEQGLRIVNGCSTCN